MESGKNYLSNERLVEEIRASQVRFRKKKRESNSKDVRVSECLTPTLVSMMVLLVDKVGNHPRWRKYSYLDDMKAEANISMIQHGLKFNIAKSQNAFGYYTQIIWRTFLTFTERERKQRKIKDRIIETTPDIEFETSFAHQAEQEQNQLNQNLDGTQRVKVDPIRMRRAVARRRKTISKELISTIDSAPIEEPSTGNE
jgi:DNA-directed RNA polymerase specialized sigma24 family protein